MSRMSRYLKNTSYSYPIDCFIILHNVKIILDIQETKDVAQDISVVRYLTDVIYVCSF